MNERLTAISDRVTKIRRQYALHEGQKKALEVLLESQLAEVESCRELDLSYQKLQKFFTAMGTEEQERLQAWFEQVVTYGLETVFGEASYQFVITGPEVRANELAIGFKVVDSGRELDPYEEMGGGVADVLSFLLQFVMVFLLRDRVNPILFLDEPMKHLSADYRDNMAKLIKELVDKTGVQILMITHDPVYSSVADVSYAFTNDGIETSIERLK